MIAKKVKEILKSKFGLMRVEDDMLLDLDLALDELDLVELVIALEKEFRIKLPEDLDAQLRVMEMKVADLVRVVEEHMPIHRVETKTQQPLNPIVGLYTVRDGAPMCCITGEKCKKLSKNEVKQNTGLRNLCQKRSCVIESNFQRLAAQLFQKTK